MVDRIKQQCFLCGQEFPPMPVDMAGAWQQVVLAHWISAHREDVEALLVERRDDWPPVPSSWRDDG